MFAPVRDRVFSQQRAGACQFLGQRLIDLGAAQGSFKLALGQNCHGLALWIVSRTEQDAARRNFEGAINRSCDVSGIGVSRVRHQATTGRKFSYGSGWWVAGAAPINLASEFLWV